MNIVNNAPEGQNINGWKPFDGLRNRYWLIENLTNSKYTLMHDAYYSYYRSGLDLLYDRDAEARTGILNALNNMLNTVNSETPNTMIIQFFFQGRYTGELQQDLSEGRPRRESPGGGSPHPAGCFQCQPV